MKIELISIGTIHSSRHEIIDDHWDNETSYIQLDPNQFSSEVLDGLEDFSHVEILFFMNQVKKEKVSLSSRYPRNNTDWPKVGIFAQRGKNRPNQIGSTICKIVKKDNLKLYVSGLDAIDRTPVLDIKPWIKEFSTRGEIKQPQWISELMKNYWTSTK